MRARVDSNLRRFQRLSKDCEKWSSKEPLKPEIAEELEVLWNLYYRVAEPIFSIGSDELAEQIDTFFVKSHTIAERAKGLESRWLIADANRHKADEYFAKEPIRMQVIAERGQVIAEIAKMREQAAALVGSFSGGRTGPVI